MRLYVTIFLIFLYVTMAGQSTASPQISTFIIDAPQLESSKKIWLYLPKDYAGGNQKYPVIYMHDAQNLFDKQTSFAGEWAIDETLDSLSAKVIVVGIEHGNEKRLQELTPYPNPKYGGGDANRYVDFIIKTLKPHIDSTYRTISDVENTAIGGSSLGALVSFYAALQHPDVFGKALLFSPSFWYSDDIYTLAGQKHISAKMYFLAGDNESDTMVSDLNKMYAIVATQHRSPAKNLMKTVVPAGQHNEKLWRESFAKAYLWLFN